MASSLFGKQSNPTPLNNPLVAVMQAMQAGQNPREFVRQMAEQDPIWREVNNAIGMQSPQQMGQKIDQNARGQGTTLNAMMNNLVRQLGLPIK